MSDDLKALRDRIDQVDDEILELLNRRARVVQEVGEVKRTKKAAFYVPSRERQIVERLAQRNEGPFPDEAIRPVFQEVISACLSLEEPLRVAYLGPEATFTHMACKSQFGLSALYVPAPTIAAVFAEVEKGQADFGVVPIENSTEGVVNHTLDTFVESDVQITGEIECQVSHCLLARNDPSEVQKVYSHPQAMAQCRGWLSTNLPGAAMIEVASTALAARLAKDDPTAAAVASELAGHLYDLPIRKRKIEDSLQNVTRFLILCRPDAPRNPALSTQQSGTCKTSILFTVRDVPGILYKVLATFADRGINLTKIESRPSKRKAWDYVFFIDIEGHVKDENVASAMTELRQVCELSKVIGSYPRPLAEAGA